LGLAGSEADEVIGFAADLLAIGLFLLVESGSFILFLWDNTSDVLAIPFDAILEVTCLFAVGDGLVFEFRTGASFVDFEPVAVPGLLDTEVVEFSGADPAVSPFKVLDLVLGLVCPLVVSVGLQVLLF